MLVVFTCTLCCVCVIHYSHMTVDGGAVRGGGPARGSNPTKSASEQRRGGVEGWECSNDLSVVLSRVGTCRT